MCKIRQEYYQAATSFFKDIWQDGYPKKYADYLKHLKINFDEV